MTPDQPLAPDGDYVLVPSKASFWMLSAAMEDWRKNMPPGSVVTLETFEWLWAAMLAARPSTPTPDNIGALREAVIEECARVAEDHAESCAQAISNAGAQNDRHAVWQREAERLASLCIAAAIRKLAALSPPSAPDAGEER